MKPKGSLPCSQQLTTRTYTEQDESSSQPNTAISLITILILHFHLHLGLPSDLFPSGFLTQILYALLTAHPAQLTFLEFIVLIKKRFK
jgi:hypothetical protein